MNLINNSVLIIWKWEFENNNVTSVEETICEQNELPECDKTSNEEAEAECDIEPDTIHTLTFKCVRNLNYQESLKIAQDMIYEGETVPIQLTHEPTNQHDSNAIKFEISLTLYRPHPRVQYPSNDH